jgi:hypothetical protein
MHFGGEERGDKNEYPLSSMHLFNRLGPPHRGGDGRGETALSICSDGVVEMRKEEVKSH